MQNKVQTQECIIAATQNTGGPSCVLWAFSPQKFNLPCVRAVPREWHEAVLAGGLLAACAPGTAGCGASGALGADFADCSITLLHSQPTWCLLLQL